jgi:hypothetical protein
VPSRPIYARFVLLLVASVPASADIVFTDNSFNPGKYDNFSATPSLDTDVTATYGQCQGCGHPGQGFEAIVSIPATAGGAFVGFLNNTFNYNPQTQGPIDSLSASVDKDLILDRSTTYFESYFYPLIEQGGNFYIASIAGGTINSGTTTGYENISQTGLTASNFGLYDFGTNSVPDFDSNPDFSASGAPMTFGLAPLVSANDAFHITVDYDNLVFDLIQGSSPGGTQSPVPESSSLALLSIFVIGLVLRGLGPAIRWKLKRH